MGVCIAHFAYFLECKWPERNTSTTYMLRYDIAQALRAYSSIAESVYSIFFEVCLFCWLACCVAVLFCPALCVSSLIFISFPFIPAYVAKAREIQRERSIEYTTHIRRKISISLFDLRICAHLNTFFFDCTANGGYRLFIWIFWDICDPYTIHIWYDWNLFFSP